MSDDTRVFGLLATRENMRKIANALAETIIVNSGGIPSDENKANAREAIQNVIVAFLPPSGEEHPNV